ncbi:MAG: hypothetical protein JWM98_3012, partial [Thermoleophilia bacterium]|nr:hypothetical protein [Thermoleophilia bacterium]
MTGDHVSTRLHARTRRRSRREAGFSIVEVIIAAFILAIVIVGATAVAGGTSRTTGATKVRDHQTQVANQMLASLQADPSWATWCRARQTPWNPASPKCDLAPWLAANPTYASLGKTTEGGGAVDFKVSAVATGIDLAADTEPGSNGKDSDGVLPDIYRLSITIAPTSGLAARFQNLHAMTVQSELNPSIRVQTGRVTVDACEALNQIDERIPVGDCTTNQEAVDLLPPPSLDTTTPTTIKKTCDGPQRATTGTDDRDCAAYKCADPEISRMPDNGLKVDCDQYPGFAPPVGAEVFFTRMVMQPVNGSVRLVNTRTGQSFGPLTFNSGRVTFRDLPVGEYDVRASVSGSGRPWKSKSVPSTGKVSVEAGL